MGRGSDVGPTPGTRAASQLDRLLAPAVLAGMIAAVVAGLVAMVATALVGRGFFTPVYGVVAPLSPSSVAQSVTAARAGTVFHVLRDPLISGSAVMLTMGGVLAMVFVPIARRVPSRWSVILPVGAGYALLVMAAISVAGMPRVTRLVAGSRPVEDLSAVPGWTVLLLEYLAFGLALGAWVALRPKDLWPEPDPLVYPDGRPATRQQRGGVPGGETPAGRGTAGREGAAGGGGQGGEGRDA